MGTFNDWTIIDANNNAAPPDGWPENTMAYSDVNDTGRAVQGTLRRYFADINGTLVSAGAADAYTLTLNETGYVAYFAGMIFKCSIVAANLTTTPTIDVNTIGAITIVDAGGNALEVGALETGGIYEFSYDGTNFRVGGGLAGAGLFVEDSDFNIFGGTGAGAALIGASGLSNFFAGQNAGGNIDTGDRNVFIGSNAGESGSSVFDSVAIGNGAYGGAGGLGTGSVNIAIGLNALGSDIITSAANNIAMGSDALVACVTALDNVAIGSSALADTVGGGTNVAVGRNALKDWAAPNGSVAIGHFAGDGTGTPTGSFNVFIGFECANTIDGSNSQNTMVGYRSGLGMDGCNFNSAFGAESLFNLTTGSNNTGVGFESLENIVTGANNVALGFEAGANANAGSSDNVFLGYQAGPAGAGAVSDLLFINNTASDTPLIGGDFFARSVTFDATLFAIERAAAQGDVAGQGQYWTRDDTPNVAMFTDDAGQDFRLNEPGATQITVLNKPADESVVNSVALQADDDLVFAMLANTNYLIEFSIELDSPSSTPDFQYDWTHPVGTEFAIGTRYFSGTGADSGTYDDEASSVGAHSIASGALRPHWWGSGIIRNGANAGNFTLEWAQQNLDAVNATIVKEGSWIRVTELH